MSFVCSHWLPLSPAPLSRKGSCVRLRYEDHPFLQIVFAAVGVDVVAAVVVDNSIPPSGNVNLKYKGKNANRRTLSQQIICEAIWKMKVSKTMKSLQYMPVRFLTLRKMLPNLAHLLYFNKDAAAHEAQSISKN